MCMYSGSSHLDGPPCTPVRPSQHFSRTAKQTKTARGSSELLPFLVILLYFNFGRIIGPTILILSEDLRVAFTISITSRPGGVFT